MPSVLLTRPKQRIVLDNIFKDTLRNSGIEVIEIPMISIDYPNDTRDLDTSLKELAEGRFELCVLSSPTAIEFFHDRVTSLGVQDLVRRVTGFATVGARSVSKLLDFGYRVTVPLPHQDAGAAALLTTLRTFQVRGKQTLILQSQIGMAVLARAFEMCGAIIQKRILYETTGPTLHDAARLLHLFENEFNEYPKVIAFFSPSAVEQFAKTLAEMGSGYLVGLPTLAAIGETTAKEIQLLLLRQPEIVAKKANQESLALDILNYLKDYS